MNNIPECPLLAQSGHSTEKSGAYLKWRRQACDPPGPGEAAMPPKTPIPKAYVSWSSGKDSAFALYEARRLGLAEIVGVLTTVNEKYDRVAMHGVRHELLDRQIAALGLPAIKSLIPSPCSNEIYEARMMEACAAIKAQGVTHIVFGASLLEDIRKLSREDAGDDRHFQRAIGFPLWRRTTARLADDMIASGRIAHLVCVDPKQLDARFAGRCFDPALLRGAAGQCRSLRREWRISYRGVGGADVSRADPAFDRRDCRARGLCLCRCACRAGWPL